MGSGKYFPGAGLYVGRRAVRTQLVGTDIDMREGADDFRYKTLVGNTVFTISNPMLGKMVVIELDGVFTVTLPASVNVVNGDYCPNLGVNFLYLLVSNETGPEIQGSWTVIV